MRQQTVSDKSTLMTEGSISRHMIAFAIPLLLGHLFQQLYNTADSLIVGNFLGSEALAAVSSSSNLIHLMIGFFNGVAGGAGVVARAGTVGAATFLTTMPSILVFAIMRGKVMETMSFSGIKS